MKKMFLTITLIGVFVSQIYSQQTNPVAEAKLIINANTNSWTRGSKLTVFFEVTNCTTNISYQVDDIPLLNYSMCLSNNGTCYIPSIAGIDDSRFYHPSYWPVDPEKTFNWTLILKIGTNVPSGNYEFGATRTIIAHALDSTNQSSVKLESNLLSIQVK